MHSVQSVVAVQDHIRRFSPDVLPQAPSSTILLDRIANRPLSLPFPTTISNCTMSDVAPTQKVAPVKRASSLMTIRGFRFRRSKDSSDDVDSYSFSVTSRGATSEGGHPTPAPDWLTPNLSADTPCARRKPVPKRAKFTIEPLDTSRPPPSSYCDPSSSPPTSSIGHHSPFSDSPKPEPKRRWTLAMAITDEAITDEVLVQEFERMRQKREVNNRDHHTEGLDLEAQGWDVWEADCGARWVGNESSEVLVPDGASKIPSTPSLPSFPTHTPLPKPATRSATTTPSASWHAARRALLTCRELVRTERHYHSSLQSLLASETATAPPALMLRYVDELACISRTFLQNMEEDPSAWGVAAAFLGVELGLENAFVGWCGVVGGWFEGREASPKRKGSKMASGEEQVAASVNGRSPLKRSPGSLWRINVPNLGNMALSPMTSPVSPSAFLSRRREKDKAKEPSSPPKRRLSVRDLAILPTQRIMRYVLLYRDLLEYTPSTSPSRALVERAVDAACRIAQKCDRAQGNAAFLHKR